MLILRIALILLLTYSYVLAASPDQLSFADSLAAEGDHYRAITEYKRFIHYQPADPRAAYAQLQIARSLIAGERWLKADRALEKIWSDYPGSSHAEQARQLFAEVAYQRGDYAEAKDRFELLAKSAAEEKKAEILYRLGLSQLQSNQPEKARQHFNQLQEPLKSELDLSVERYLKLPHKSPRLAGTLSAILPGAGQLYTERPRQAGIALALNAAFIYGAIEAWNNENYAVSGVLSLFELGWYGGNIYNAVNNAHKYNHNRQQQFLEQLQQNLNLSLGWHNDRPALTARFNF